MLAFAVTKPNIMQLKVTIADKIQELIPIFCSMLASWLLTEFIILICCARRVFWEVNYINDNFWGASAISPMLARTWESQIIALIQSRRRAIDKNYVKRRTTLAVSRLLTFLDMTLWFRWIKFYMFDWIYWAFSMTVLESFLAIYSNLFWMQRSKCSRLFFLSDSLSLNPSIFGFSTSPIIKSLIC